MNRETICMMAVALCLRQARLVVVGTGDTHPWILKGKDPPTEMFSGFIKTKIHTH